MRQRVVSNARSGLPGQSEGPARRQLRRNSFRGFQYFHVRFLRAYVTVVRLGLYSKQGEHRNNIRIPKLIEGYKIVQFFSGKVGQGFAPAIGINITHLGSMARSAHCCFHNSDSGSRLQLREVPDRSFGFLQSFRVLFLLTRPVFG